MNPRSSLFVLPLLAVSLAACSIDADPNAELELESDPDGSSIDLDATDRLESDAPSRPAEQLCGGAREANVLGIVAPTPPVAAYDPAEEPDCNDPDVECGVTPATLQNAINGSKRVLVLDDGVYPTNAITTDYLSLEGREIWAKNPGGAVLEFGIETGGNNSLTKDFSGSVLRGLVFDVDDFDHVPSHPASGPTIVSAWGGATDLHIEDCIFHGNRTIDVGIYVTSAEGLELRRLEIDGLFTYGALVEGAGTVTTPVLVEDIRVDDIGNHPTGAPTGVGLRLGETAEITRVRARDIRWAGIVVNGDSDGTVVSHVDLDRIGGGFNTGGVGVYLDNISDGTTVQTFCVGPRTRIGVNSEWDHWCDANLPQCTTPPAEMFSRAFDSVIEDGLIESELIGVHFDQGTVNGHVENVTFRGYTHAGIDFFHNLATGDSAPNWSIGASTQTGNVFHECQTDEDICDVTHAHWNDATPACAYLLPPC